MWMITLVSRCLSSPGKWSKQPHLTVTSNRLIFQIQPGNWHYRGFIVSDHECVCGRADYIQHEATRATSWDYTYLKPEH